MGDPATGQAAPLTRAHAKVIFAASLGTVFEWYDFYLYGALAAVIAQQFFTALDATSGFIFALLAFAAGVAVRPFGALVFGRLGDQVGRKPIAAWLVELFPTRIRYSSMSLPYHIGNGWFGGFLPTTAFAMVAASGDIYFGLWYPIAIALLTVAVGALFLPETRDLPLER